MRTLFLAIASLILLAGCSSQQPTEQQFTPRQQATLDSIAASGETVPDCAKVWVVGDTLSKKYLACKDATTGRTHFAKLYACADGTTLTAYNDQFWAHLGGVIHQGATDSPQYTQEFTSCSPQSASSTPSPSPTF